VHEGTGTVIETVPLELAAGTYALGLTKPRSGRSRSAVLAGLADPSLVSSNATSRDSVLSRRLPRSALPANFPLSDRNAEKRLMRSHLEDCHFFEKPVFASNFDYGLQKLLPRTVDFG